MFVDPLARIFDDPDHSETEVREIIVGYSSKPRLLVVGFTERFRTGQTDSRASGHQARAETP